NGEQVTLDVGGTTMQGTARGSNVGTEITAMIRLEQVRISQTETSNALRLPLATCMYLGDRWECLFRRGDMNEGGVRAYSPYRLETGEYWLQLPAERLWVF
ncbi:MAG: ABC transporter ATP-binding protein, partial [Janthinobacterium lividum]